MTRRLEPLDRVKELGDASVPFGFDVHAIIHSEDAPTLERHLHERFSARRVNQVNYRKEFFRIPLSELRTVIEELGVETDRKNVQKFTKPEGFHFQNFVFPTNLVVTEGGEYLWRIYLDGEPMATNK